MSKPAFVFFFVIIYLFEGCRWILSTFTKQFCQWRWLTFVTLPRLYCWNSNKSYPSTFFSIYQTVQPQGRNWNQTIDVIFPWDFGRYLINLTSSYCALQKLSPQFSIVNKLIQNCFCLFSFTKLHFDPLHSKKDFTVV